MSYNKGFNDGINAVWERLSRRDRKRHGKMLVSLIRLSAGGIVEYSE